MAEQQQLQALLPVQHGILQHVQPVALQAQEAQLRQAAERAYVYFSDVVVAQVQFLQVLTLLQ